MTQHAKLGMDLEYGFKQKSVPLNMNVEAGSNGIHKILLFDIQRPVGLPQFFLEVSVLFATFVGTYFCTNILDQLIKLLWEILGSDVGRFLADVVGSKVVLPNFKQVMGLMQ